MKRIWQNKIYIAKLATRWTGGLFAILGFVDTFAPLNVLLVSTVSILWRILFSVIILFFVWTLSYIGCAIYLLLKRWKRMFRVSNGYHVYVQYGDVFNEGEVLKPQEKRNIVIPVNRCFDTLVDDDLISSNTLHGMAMKRLYSSGNLNPDTLNDALQHSLSTQQVKSETVMRGDKRKGNLRRYPVGTVAEIKDTDICTYFFLGLSTFDQNLHAHVSDEEYVLALIKLLEFCNTRSQKYPVVMPLIGAGASETKKSERDILEYLIKLIKLNKNLINCDLHIVVRDSGKENIAIADL